MSSSSNFFFHSSLNDFLLYAKRNTWIAYHFNGSPAVKDAIEATGVPHPEVAAIMVNNAPVSFSYLLQNGDAVIVYPVMKNSPLLDSYLLSHAKSYPHTFVLDVHLGALAKELRLLGFDALYRNDYSDKEITDIAGNEQRIVLTRDVGLLKHRTIIWGYWLRSQHAEAQVIEVIKRFELFTKFKPFARCLACNGEINEVRKEEIVNTLPPKTIDYFNKFYQCACCKRVYWKGSHYERMQQTVKRIFERLKNNEE